MNNFHFRAAQPEDEAAVAALSAHIWEGEDYVPRQFANWVADPHGQFTVVYEGQELVGFGKLTRLAEGEWWLEGLRVHPQHRGRGIARLLHNYAVEMADRIASGVLRFATNSRNEAVHKLAKETAFELVSTNILCDTEPSSESAGKGSFSAVTSGELSELQRWLAASPLFKAWGQLFERRWKWFELMPRLSSLVAEERVYWWRGSGEDGRGLVMISHDQNGTLGVNYIDGDQTVLRPLAEALRQPGVFGDVERLRLKPPADPVLRAALEAAGWEIETYEMSVFERQLATARPTQPSTITGSTSQNRR